MIKLLKSLIKKQEQLIKTIEGQTNPQLVEMRLKAEVTIELAEIIIDYQRGNKTLLKIISKH